MGEPGLHDHTTDHPRALDMRPAAHPASSPRPHRNAWIRGIGILLLFEAMSFAAGVGVWLILHGLAFGLFRVSMYSRPLLNRFLRLVGAPEVSAELPHLPLTPLRALTLSLHLGMRIAMVALGVSLLVRLGFCGQNLICALLR